MSSDILKRNMEREWCQNVDVWVYNGSGVQTLQQKLKNLPLPHSLEGGGVSEERERKREKENCQFISYTAETQAV